jgi:signal peptidase I
MNFSLILFFVVLFTGAMWALNRWVWAPRRDPEQSDPWWVDYTAGLFPVFFVIFLLRSFVAEPFRIPSGSMLPTLLIGDLILVNKYEYGIRLPVIHKKIVDMGQPQRGDVVVFRYPPDPSLDYIKRLIGVPGDKVLWRAGSLSVNGKTVDLRADGEFFDADRLSYTKQYREKLSDREHLVLTEPGKPSFVHPMDSFKQKDLCRFDADSVECVVPQGHYFMMGDNRDNSLDSRFWGFVPEQNIVGRAFFIWMNFSDLKRIGRFY